MKFSRRRFLELAAGAVALPAVPRIAKAQTTTWVSLGGGLTSAPAICSWGAFRRDVFARGEDNALWHKWFKFFPDRNVFAWSEWESLGGALTSPPAAVSWGEGRIDVFVRGTDRALWHRWFTGGDWSRWESLGGVLNFGPAVSSWGSRRLDVFARGTDNTIFQRTFDRGWGDWTSIAEAETTVGLPGIAAVSSAPGKIDLFAWGATHVNNQGVAINFLLHKSYRNGWKNSHRIGLGSAPPSLTTSLAVAAWREDRLDWFMRGADNALEHSAGVVSDSGLGVTFPPRSRGGFLTSGPAAVALTSGFEGIGIIEVVVRGADNALWNARLVSPTPD